MPRGYRASPRPPGGRQEGGADGDRGVRRRRARRRRGRRRAGRPVDATAGSGGGPRRAGDRGGVHRRHLRERLAALPGAAAGGEDAPPPARRVGRGVEHRQRVLPGRAPGRLRVLAPVAASPRRASPAVAPGRGGPGGAGRAADRHPLRVGAARRRTGAVDPARAGRHGGTPVLRAVHGEPHAPALVRRHRPPERARSLLPLRRRQRREPAVAARLPARGRAAPLLGRPQPPLDDRLRDLRGPAPRVLGAGAPHRPTAADRRPRGRAVAALVGHAPALGRVRRRAVGPHARRDPPHLERRGRHAAPLGGPAGAVPRHLHRGVRPPPGAGRGRGEPGPEAAGGAPDAQLLRLPLVDRGGAGPAPVGVQRGGDGGPRSPVARPARHRPAHRLLPDALGGRRGGRRHRRPIAGAVLGCARRPGVPVAALACPRSAFGGAGPTAPDATTHGVGAMLARARGAISPRVLVVAAAVLGTAVASVAIRSSGTQEALVTAMLVAAVGAMAAFVLTRSAAGFATSIGVILALGLLVPANATRYQSRTFYGVHRVYEDQANGGRHVLLNGSTVHGMEDVTGPQAGQPTTYYHPTGPIGRWFALHRADPPRRIGVVGLGSGALAWYGRAGDRMRFYEIDDAVVHIAQDPDLFTFVDRSKADVDVEVGDGRLLLAEEAGPKADALVIDAFSGDSIPAHLLTDEAVGLYLRRLDEHGTLVVHISNRFFDFRPVVAKLAAAHDLAAYVAFDPATPEQAAQGKLASTWVVMARTAADAGVADQPGWTRMDGGGSVPLWTDDRSDLLRLLRR
ncbi:MAG: fused MFS/spermidine synthase [Acidimicrobiales bacterium]